MRWRSGSTAFSRASMDWEGSSKPRRAGVWQWTRQCICTTPVGPTPRWGTARRKRRTAWRHESMEASKVRRSKTGLASRRHCAAARLRAAAKRRNQPPETTQEDTRHTVKFKPGLDHNGKPKTPVYGARSTISANGGEDTNPKQLVALHI